VLFTDKFSIEVRSVNERKNYTETQQKVRTIIFWADINGSDKTELLVCPKPYNATAYKNSILRLYGFASTTRLNAKIFMHDN